MEVNDKSREILILRSIIDQEDYLLPPLSRTEEFLLQLKNKVEGKTYDISSIAAISNQERLLKAIIEDERIDITSLSKADDILISAMLAEEYTEEPKSPIEYWLLELKDKILSGGLPADYIQKEYIESTGRQYINLGIIPTWDTIVEITFSNFSPSYNNTIFGIHDIVRERRYSIDIGRTINIYKYSSTVKAYVRNIAKKQTLKINEDEVYIDDQLQSVKLDRNYEFLDPTDDAYLFTSNATGGSTRGTCQGRIHSCKIIDERGRVIRDMTPCLNPEGKAGMFDLAKRKFHGNIGTGEFVTD